MYFKRFKYGKETSCFERAVRLKQTPNNSEPNPLKITTYLAKEVSNERHYRFCEPTLITGIADFVQVHMRYTVNPVS